VHREVTLRDLSLGDLQRSSKLFKADAMKCLDAKRSLQSRTAEGAPSPKRVAARLFWWRKHLASAKS
jgi:argininosuccinate lyase